MNGIAVFFTEHKKRIFLVLTFLAGVYLFAGRCDYQAAVSQGDHGRDLYAFKRVMEGAVPYRDFSWLFGPLMAYYYSFFFKIFGVSIQSALIGQNILIIFTGVFIYRACAVALTPGWAFLCALSYWALRGNEFFYTYNHSGGLLCMVFICYALMRYIDDGKLRHVAGGFAAALVFMFIRLNMACAVLAVWTASLALVDILKGDPRLRFKLRVYFYGAGACLLLTAFVYWLYFRGMPVYVFWESFPLSKEQRTDTTASLWDALKYLGDVLRARIYSSTMWLAMAGAVVIAAGKVAAMLFQRGAWSRQEKIKVLAGIFFSAGMIAATLHEFFLSGVEYRLYWALPPALLLIFLLLGRATAGLDMKIVRGILYATVFWLVFASFQSQDYQIKRIRVPEHLLERGKTRVYTKQSEPWYSTIRQTCDFIDKNVPAGEKLFAMPFDTIYNFLTGRDEPTRQWVFFQHMIIPEEQDRQVIQDLEREKVNWVLVSNRAVSQEDSLGLLGRDYCHMLWKYINSHYQPVARFGEWTSAPSWAWNHGVVIFKRKVPFVH